MAISKKRLAELAKIGDDDIDYSDIPELDDSFWENANLAFEIRIPNSDTVKALKALSDDKGVVRHTSMESFVKSVEPIENV